jgi:hypothetical protein
MTFRKLRIAWSVGWGIFCVLLIILWVRSYSRNEGLSRHNSENIVRAVYNVSGSVCVHRTTGLADDPRSAWVYFCDAPANWFRGFGYGIGGTVWYVHAPHWFLVLLGIGAATAPWIRHLQFRFSLRTLLIATTLVAVVLGLVVWLR